MLSDADLELAERMSEFVGDPLGFVVHSFPWREPGPLSEYDGPDEWQEDFLRELGEQIRAQAFDGVTPVAPILRAVSSGHGIGKGVLSGMLTAFIMSTRPFSQGTVTANTAGQLESKTWATIKKWMKLCITAHWFEIGAARIRHLEYPDSWFVHAQTCKEENSEAFAGQHAANSTSWYLCDEASGIPQIIKDVAMGGLTDGEPMFFAWGNPTRNTGWFHEATFGRERNKWKPRIIDSRSCKFTNKDLLQQWVEEYGEDSDFVRVRVRGLAPRASDTQFIPSDVVFDAQNRLTVDVLKDEPLVAGFDIARGGFDNCVIRFRWGNDASHIPAIKVPGEESRDSMRMVSLATDLMDRKFRCADGVERKIAMLFIDQTGVGGPIYDRLVQLGFDDRTMGVNFGGRAPEADKFDNMRAYMWARMREWLRRGRIDKDPQLETDLTAPGYGHSKRDRLLLESKESMKKRGLASPDDGDALALTFAAPVVERFPKLQRPDPILVMDAGVGGAKDHLGWMGL